MATVVQFIPPPHPYPPVYCTLFSAVVKLILLDLNKSGVYVGALLLMKNKNKLFVFAGVT